MSNDINYPWPTKVNVRWLISEALREERKIITRDIEIAIHRARWETENKIYLAVKEERERILGTLKKVMGEYPSEQLRELIRELE